MDENGGSGLLLTVEPLKETPTASQFLQESKNWLEQQKAKVLRVDPELERSQVERLRAVRARRDAKVVAKAVSDVQEAAANGENLMPRILAARCMTTSAPRQTFLHCLASVRSASSNSIALFSAVRLSFALLKATKSATLTCAPDSSSRSARCEPMNPAPPVTTTFLLVQNDIFAAYVLL